MPDGKDIILIEDLVGTILMKEVFFLQMLPSEREAHLIFAHGGGDAVLGSFRFLDV